MSVIVVGASHRTTDLSVLERLAVPSDDAAKALAALLELEHVAEAVLLSTCNRVEVYAHVTRFHAGHEQLRGWLANRAGMSLDELDEVTFTEFDEAAAAHLFRVTAGADSMVVGEQQIAVQVKQAMEDARLESAARSVLQRMFRDAVRVGRRVRRETDIASGASSMVDVGLSAAVESLGGGLSDLDVLIVGAGKLGALAGGRLADSEVRRQLVWNRSGDKATRLAERVGGQVVDDLTLALRDVDLVVCTTGAAHWVLEADQVQAAMAGREDRPLVMLDLAMPRNVEPAVVDVDGVTLVDLTNVRRAADRQLQADVLAAAEVVIADEAGNFASWMRAREVDPTISALRNLAEDVRLAEIERLSGRLGELDERQSEALEALTRGIINTLLHEPTVRLKLLAGNQAAEHAVGALRELFDLDESQ